MLGGLRGGDEEAVRRLWQRYFQPLVRLARGRLAAGCGRTADAEDVALDAFFGLCQQLARPAPPQLRPEQERALLAAVRLQARITRLAQEPTP